MALGIYSGKDAYVDTIPCVQSWQVTPAVAAQRYTASCTEGGSNVAPGIQNWTGQISGIGAHPAEVFPDGTVKAFQGVINATAGQGDLLSLTGNIIIEQLTIDINKETAAPISWQATFGFNGTPSEAATSATDATLADAKYGDALDIKIGTSDANEVTIATASCAIRTAQMMFKRQLSTYPQNGTTYRKAGHLECDVNFTVFSPSMVNAAYTINALKYVELWVSATDYWQFDKIRFLGKSGLQVDRSSNAVIGYTVNGQWNAVDAGTLGFIRYYDGTPGSEQFITYYGDEP